MFELCCYFPNDSEGAMQIIPFPNYSEKLPYIFIKSSDGIVVLDVILK